METLQSYSPAPPSDDPDGSITPQGALQPPVQEVSCDPAEATNGDSPFNPETSSPAFPPLAGPLQAPDYSVVSDVLAEDQAPQPGTSGHIANLDGFGGGGDNLFGGGEYNYDTNSFNPSVGVGDLGPPGELKPAEVVETNLAAGLLVDNAAAAVPGHMETPASSADVPGSPATPTAGPLATPAAVRPGPA